MKCKSTGNAQSLLLTATKFQSVFFQLVLKLFPDGSIPQGFFYNLVKPGPLFDSVSPGAVGNVVVNAHGKRIRLLENHAHIFPQKVHIDFRVKNVAGIKLVQLLLFSVLQLNQFLLPQKDLPRDAASLNKIVHAVYGF